MSQATGRTVAMVVYNDLMHDARVHREATTLVEAGYDVRVIGMCTPATPPLVGWDRLSVVRVEVGTRLSLRIRYACFWRRAHAALVKLRPAAIHAHDLDALAPAWLAARRMGVPLVYDAHELWTELPSLVGRPIVRGIWRALAGALIPSVDGVITVSDGVATELAKRYAVAPVVVRNYPRHREPPSPLPLRKMIGCGEEPALVLYQGSLVPGYGIDRTIDVMDLLPEAHLVIIGGGPLEGTLRQQAGRSACADRVTFLPPVPFAELGRYTAAADVGLFLGESAGLNIRLGLPSKLVEYMAAGVPFVATDWAETRRLTEKYGAGRLVPPDATGEQIAEGVRAVLRDREQFVRRCHRARLDLVWENEAGKLVDLYRSLPWR